MKAAEKDACLMLVAANAAMQTSLINIIEAMVNLHRIEQRIADRRSDQ